MDTSGGQTKTPGHSHSSNAVEDRLANWKRPIREECPICMLPMPPFDLQKAEVIYLTCCGKTICCGCMMSRDIVDMKEPTENGRSCPFCRRKPGGDPVEKNMKLAKAGYCMSMFVLGNYYFDGLVGLKEDKREALKWYHKAMDAGSAVAALKIYKIYKYGDGIERDKAQSIYYLQKAADLGLPSGCFILAAHFMEMHNIWASMLYLRKAAICGSEVPSIFKALQQGYREGYITKDEYAATLREHQEVINEMKSESRERYKNQSDFGFEEPQSTAMMELNKVLSKK